MKKPISFTVSRRGIKYLGIHLTKDMKDLCTETYKILIKETEDTSKWKDTLCSWIGRINLI